MIPPLFALLCALAAGLAWIALWSGRSVPFKALALGLAALTMLVGYGALIDLRGRPKPIRDEFLAAGEDVTVLSSVMEEGRAIYLWVQLPGISTPFAYQLPWDRKAALELQDATRTAERTGGKVVGKYPFARYERSVEDRGPLFYSAPQPAPPPKAVD